MIRQWVIAWSLLLAVSCTVGEGEGSKATSTQKAEVGNSVPEGPAALEGEAAGDSRPKSPSVESRALDEKISVPAPINGAGFPKIVRADMKNTPDLIGVLIYPDFASEGVVFEGFDHATCKRAVCRENNEALTAMDQEIFMNACHRQGFDGVFIDCCGPRLCSGLPVASPERENEV